MTGWREDNRDSRLQSLHLREVASRDNSICGIVHTQRRRCWEKVESILESQKEGVVLPQHMPALSLSGSLASHHQRSFPAKT